MGRTTIQWASSVLEVSSELTELEHSARQVLGKPNVLPAGGSNPNAWRAYQPNEVEFIKVSFDIAMPIKQIAIGESFNPGAIAKIYGYDENDREVVLYENAPGPVPELKRDTFEVLNAQRQELGLPAISANSVVSGVNSPVINNVNAPVILAAAGASFIIRNVFFDFDKDLLKEQSWIEIRNLVKFMNDYPNAIVELAGHTDSHGTDEYNVDLSMRRAERMKRAIIQLGIDEDRLRFVWYGETVPIATNRTRAGRALNRRVEFTILKLE